METVIKWWQGKRMRRKHVFNKIHVSVWTCVKVSICERLFMLQIKL